MRAFDYARPATVADAVGLLARHRGAAKVLNISRDTLTNKLKKIPHVRPDGWRAPESAV